MADLIFPTELRPTKAFASGVLCCTLMRPLPRRGMQWATFSLKVAFWFSVNYVNC